MNDHNMYQMFTENIDNLNQNKFEANQVTTNKTDLIYPWEKRYLFILKIGKRNWTNKYNDELQKAKVMSRTYLSRSRFIPSLSYPFYVFRWHISVSLSLRTHLYVFILTKRICAVWCLVHNGPHNSICIQKLMVCWCADIVVETKWTLFFASVCRTKVTADKPFFHSNRWYFFLKFRYKLLRG